MIEPIVNWNFGDTFKLQNEQNQRQHTHKKTSKQHKQKTLVKIINPYPIKYPGTHQSHTLNKTVLYVD